ncbi:hypothetical protein BGX27_006931 [Mortierella sp. AM989]|nr:hypothetical protein BGX27_006931 [Mortierella sp. AM989]
MTSSSGSSNSVQGDSNAIPLHQPGNSSDDPPSAINEGQRQGSISQAEQSASESESNLRYKWYFKPNAAHTKLPDNPMYLCLTEEQPPIKIDTRRYTDWMITLSNLEPGRYDTILGFSISSTQIDRIISITLTFRFDNASITPTSEVISGGTLRELASYSSSGSKIRRLKLQHQRFLDRSRKFYTCTLETRWASLSHSTEDDSHFELHYIEFQRPYSALSESDPEVIEHYPYIWSLDLLDWRIPQTEDQNETPDCYIHHAISGDGNFVALLTHAKETLFIDVWDIRSIGSSGALVKAKTINDCRSLRRKLLNTLPYGCLTIKVLPVSPDHRLFYALSLSWNASRVALLDATPQYMKESRFRKTAHESVFAIYERQSEIRIASQPRFQLQRATSYQHIPELKKFSGFGKFHFVEAETNMEAERFVTCDGDEVRIYSTHNQWGHIFTIQLSPYPMMSGMGLFLKKNFLRIPESRRLIESLKGRHFAWNGNANYMISIYNLQDGSIISSFKNVPERSLLNISGSGAPVEFSSDGTLLAIQSAGTIKTFRTATGSLLGTYKVPEWFVEIPSIKFIRGDIQILVEGYGTHELLGKGRMGMILSTNSLNDSIYPSDTILSPGAFFKIPSKLDAEGKQRLLTFNGFSLQLTRLDDCILKPYTHPEVTWNEQCTKDLSPLSECPRIFESASGLKFKADIRIIPSKTPDRVRTAPSVVVIISAGNRERSFEIPPYALNTGPNEGYRCARFLDTSSQLVVASKSIIMIWGLPENFDDGFNLLLFWDVIYPLKITMEEEDEWWHGESGPWQICSHQKLRGVFNFNGKDEILTPNIESPFDATNTLHFTSTFYFTLPSIYEEAEEECKKAIIRYLQLHINRYPVPKDPSIGVLTAIAYSWRTELGTHYENLTRALLDGSNGNWIPPTDREPLANPLMILYANARKHPKAMNVAQTIIDHCIQHARLEKDSSFIQPVVLSLAELLNPKLHQPDVASKTLQRLAFLRVNNRQHIIRYHAIAQLPLSWLKFWDKDSRRLFKAKDPILQANNNTHPSLASQLDETTQFLFPDKNVPDLLDETFTRELFQANFDMIWSVRKSETCGTPYQESSRSNVILFFQWISMLLSIIWYDCVPRRDMYIRSHRFTQEHFDNPAIAALITYKWNTIGFKFWVTRITIQCGYYILILIVIYNQINGEEFKPMENTCMAIIVFSLIFLWMEVVQLIRDGTRYFRALYNFVDIGMFGLPLAACINHLLMAKGSVSEEYNTGLFSFSVILIFLHMLFELRVLKSVCYFTTIIIQAISEIKVFFFIFASGIIAFTVAGMHLLRGCSYTGCGALETEFPDNFYTAISTTYFFMGGRYDQISNEMNNSNFWRFQTLMIIFFFFTVIMMLNVLIALIHKAFEDGDENWRTVWLENRLNVIELAEDISFRIPGFRESHNWFPETIYYSATPQQIRLYEQKYFSEQEEFSDPSNGSKNIDLEVPFQEYLNASIHKRHAASFHISGKTEYSTGTEPTAINSEKIDSLSVSGTTIRETNTLQDPSSLNNENTGQTQQILERLQQELSQSRDEIRELRRQLQENQQTIEKSIRTILTEVIDSSESRKQK